MTIEITIKAEHPQELHTKLLAVLLGTKIITTPQSVEDGSQTETDKPEAPKTRKPRIAKAETADTAVEKSEEPVSKYTLQDAIDRAKEIAGDGKDDKVLKTLQSINTKLGIGKVRDLPVDKIDGYIVELEKAFPKQAKSEEATIETGMFD